MKNALNNQVGMLGDMFLWLVANLKQGVIYFIKQALPPNKSAGSVPMDSLGQSGPNKTICKVMEPEKKKKALLETPFLILLPT